MIKRTIFIFGKDAPYKMDVETIEFDIDMTDEECDMVYSNWFNTYEEASRAIDEAAEEMAKNIEYFGGSWSNS